MNGVEYLRRRREKMNPPTASTPRRCRVCGCTNDDCRQCIAKTGRPCYWVELDLCSACLPTPPTGKGA